LASNARDGWSSNQRLQFSKPPSLEDILARDGHPSCAAREFVRTPDDAATTQDPGANPGANHEKNGIGLAARCAKPRFTENRGVAVALDRNRMSERWF
jgi:hypothetical protein